MPASLLMMPVFRSRLMRSLPISKNASCAKEVDILKDINIRGIGFSGPCQTPDFVPASIYLRARKSSQEIVSEDDTTLAESLGEYSLELSSAPTSPTRKTSESTRLVNVEVRLHRGRKGLGLRLVGGAEEGTQVNLISCLISNNFNN